jgi:hypothetical protein
MSDHEQQQIAAIEHEPMQGVTAVDWVLAVLTLVPFLILLMFAITPVTRAMHYPRTRRLILLGMLVLELALAGLVAAVLLS